mmetsp:Transcript_56401/g.181071  ORF Transcript_56401/g.181071 Transcript_56401/m.181071 type:complete len:84 (-) Transcript_56401:1527-1778(-)
MGQCLAMGLCLSLALTVWTGFLCPEVWRRHLKQGVRLDPGLDCLFDPGPSVQRDRHPRVYLGLAKHPRPRLLVSTCLNWYLRL